MDANVRQVSSVAQRVKQMLILLAGIETKRQDGMSKGEREHFIHTSYNNWCEILKTKYPDAAIHRYMVFTTGKMTIRIDGIHLYRNFQEAIRIYHNDWNPIWTKCTTGQTSGKNGDDMWRQFIYLHHCETKGTLAEDVVPEDFDVTVYEKQKWIQAYKQLGPPCDLFPPCPPCHEFLANAKQLAARGTGSKKRKADELSRSKYREKKAKATIAAVTAAMAERKTIEAVDLGRAHTCQMLMKLASREKDKQFDRLYKLHGIMTDPVQKGALQQQMVKLVNTQPLQYAAAETQMYGSASRPVDLTTSTAAAASTPGSTPASTPASTPGRGHENRRRDKTADDDSEAEEDDDDDESFHISDADDDDDESFHLSDADDDDDDDDDDDISLCESGQIMDDVLKQSGFVRVPKACHVTHTHLCLTCLTHTYSRTLTGYTASIGS